MVLHWDLWLRVLGSIGDDGRVCLDGGGIHWNIILFFLLLSFGLFLIFLFFLFILLFLILFLGLLLIFLFFLLGSRFLLLLFLFNWLWLFGGLGSCRFALLGLLLHVFGQRLNEVISILGFELNCLRFADEGSSQ